MILYRYSTETLCSFIFIAGSFLFASVAVAANPSPKYLSGDLADRITTSQESGGLHFDTAVPPAKDVSEKIRIKGKLYKRGLAHCGNGEVLVSLDGQFETFQCDAGLQWSRGQNFGGVIFQVYVDGKKAFDSGILRENDSAKTVNISVKGADELRLKASGIHGGTRYARINWADARLTPDPTAKSCTTRAMVDIAAFAQVVTSDPNRNAGTASSRSEELPAEDIFMETELKAADYGSYAVPVASGGLGCIGLRWYEMRHLRRLELHWPKDASKPPANAVQLQYWSGASAWQGQWKPLLAAMEQSKDTWSWRIGSKDQPTGSVRIRWIFPATKSPLVLKSISAYSRTPWKKADIYAEVAQPAAADQTKISIYNGVFLKSDGKSTTRNRQWNLSRPIRLKVIHSKPGSYKADRTVLRFELPGKTLGVAVEDVLASGCVYVPDAGLFVSTNPPKKTLAQYMQSIAGKKTVLQQVRQLPDQSLAGAMAKTHNPIQSNGPVMLSLACDNRKFIVNRQGLIRFDLYDADCKPPVEPNKWTETLKTLFESHIGGKGKLSRHMQGDWLPKPVISATQNGIQYRQCTYVAPIDEKSPHGCPPWYRERAACVAEYTFTNTQTSEADVDLKLVIHTDGKITTLDGLQEVKNGLISVHGDRLLAYIDTSEAAPLSLTKQTRTIAVSGRLAGGKSARVVVYLPAWRLKPTDYAVLSNAERWSAQTDRYWKDIVAEGMQIDIPVPLLQNVIRASQVHCMLATRNEQRGKLIAPWVSADRYGPLGSESHSIIRGMDMCGQHDYARRALEYFLSRYNSQGFLTTGYTMVGTGENLWTLAEHHARHPDRKWLGKFAPQLDRACKWIITQRAKTKRRDARNEKVPEYGLMPPGVTADWERFGYRFFNDAQYCLGLESAAKALAGIEYPHASIFQNDAKEYREDLLRAYRWTQLRCPVVALGNGTWVPNHPSILDIFGNVEEMVPAEDANRSWCYSVEIGSHHLAANRILDPATVEVGQMMDYLEDHQFLRTGWFDYPEEKNRKDVFNLGGFAKVQPYYARNAEVHALRDDVKPFLRAYFNALASLLNEENLSFWEHFHNTAGWNKTHETGWFLCQTAIMFVTERGDDLWLAPFVTNRWLGDGMSVWVRKAPSRFGPVTYKIDSHVGQGFIEASIEPPKRKPPKHIVIRIRHPQGKPIKSVTVNGKSHTDFDLAEETVRLVPDNHVPDGRAITVKVKY